jgi:TolA-binding protein
VLAQIYGQDSTASPGLTDSLYREIVRRFPKSEFAAEADHLLGGPGIQQESDPAGALYAQAEGVLLRDENKAAVDLFTLIVALYPASPYASRAQYAIGWIYEQLTLQPDSAIVQYKKLVTLYPGSSYAAAVQPRLAEVELAKKQAASAKDTVSQREEKKQKPVDENQPPRQTTEQKRLKPEEDIVPPKKSVPATPVDGPGP